MKLKKNLKEEDFKVMKKLEAKYYDGEFITPYEEAYRWYMTYEYSIRCVECDGKVVGFINMFPISDKVYDLLKVGKFNDKYLKLEDLINLDTYKGNDLNLFLSCVLIDSEYRKTDALTSILNEYVKVYKEVNKNFKIKNVITDNVTQGGANFSERLGFHKVIDSNHDSVVYEITFEDFIKNVRELDIKRNK
ncbi:MAG: hypothetical protein ACRDDY_19745 [Clostridium sp.]|uniref:hypothetical protein n=1 Tax=Clostridium sp. TaxID=1506 RepID=UPI003EE57F7E